jgi:hypothetical protein
MFRAFSPKHLKVILHRWWDSLDIQGAQLTLVIPQRIAVFHDRAV